MLQIVVWITRTRSGARPTGANAKSTDAASGFLIDEKGDIQFPYAGTVHVAGRDVSTIQKELYNRPSKCTRSRK